jgi:adenosine kinase
MKEWSGRFGHNSNRRSGNNISQSSATNVPSTNSNRRGINISQSSATNVPSTNKNRTGINFAQRLATDGSSTNTNRRGINFSQSSATDVSSTNKYRSGNNFAQRSAADGSRVHSIIAIGNPIVDISAKIDKEGIKKYRLKWGETVFADEGNVGFFEDLEKKSDVTYIPGGSIQNTLRVASWCLNMEKKNKGKYKLTMLGATGNDGYKDKIINSLKSSGVNPLLQSIPDMETSRCGVGIYKKERCLLAQIRASNCLTEDFVKEHEKEIYQHDALIIEGYFLAEKFDICKNLCHRFRKENKLVILTIGAVFIVEAHLPKVLEIANDADMFICNFDELKAFAGDKKENNYKDIFEKAFKKLKAKDRLFLVTDGSKGVLVSKYDYKKGKVDYILQSFPTVMKSEEIVDLNGAGDSFLGGFLSQYIKGSSLSSCCKAGNDAASYILKSVGCTFPNNAKIKFDP